LRARINAAAAESNRLDLNTGPAAWIMNRANHPNRIVADSRHSPQRTGRNNRNRGPSPAPSAPGFAAWNATDRGSPATVGPPLQSPSSAAGIA